MRLGESGSSGDREGKKRPCCFADALAVPPARPPGAVSAGRGAGAIPPPRRGSPHSESSPQRAAAVLGVLPSSSYRSASQQHFPCFPFPALGWVLWDFVALFRPPLGARCPQGAAGHPRGLVPWPLVALALLVSAGGCCWQQGWVWSQHSNPCWVSPLGAPCGSLLPLHPLRGTSRGAQRFVLLVPALEAERGGADSSLRQPANLSGSYLRLVWHPAGAGGVLLPAPTLQAPRLFVPCAPTPPHTRASLALFPSSPVSKQHKSPLARLLIYIFRDYHAERKVVVEKLDGALSSCSFSPWVTAELWRRGEGMRCGSRPTAPHLTLSCPLYLSSFLSC